MRYHVTGRTTFYFQVAVTKSRDVKIDSTIEADSPEDAEAEARDEALQKMQVSSEWECVDYLDNLTTVENPLSAAEHFSQMRDQAYQSMLKYSTPLFPLEQVTA